MRWRLLGTLMLCALGAASACGGDDDEPVALIVYEARASGGGGVNVYTINPETSETVQVTDTEKYDGNPAWAPDRSRILFISDRDGESRQMDVYTMAPDGTDPQRLTETPDRAEYSPKFAPDGSKLAWVTRYPEEGRGWWLTVADGDGTNPRDIAGPYKFVEFPAWTPDGKEIFFSAIDLNKGNADIFSIDVATGDMRVRIESPGADVCPHFTRDGTVMTYASNNNAEGKEPDVFEHDLDSSDTTGDSDTRLTSSPARDDYANISPDGTTFVFLTNRDNDFELYLMDRDGGNQRRLTNTPGLRENVPDW